MVKHQFESPLIQTMLGRPDAIAIMYQHLQAIAVSVGEEAGMVRLRFAEALEHLDRDRFHSGSHVEWTGRESQVLRGGKRQNGNDESMGSGTASTSIMQSP